MNDEIELINDGDGLAVIGKLSAVDQFLDAEGLSSRDLGLHRLGTTLQATSGAMKVGSELAANSGRWVKLTRESAEAIRKYGLMKGSTSGVSRAVVYAKGQPQGIKSIVEFSSRAGTGIGSVLAGPADLALAASVMNQVAMQQTMDEITDYLVAIDQKVDDILRAQKDSVLAGMIGVGDVIEEAMTIRAEVGSVGDVTWSKVQGTTLAVAKTQAYALLQLEAQAEKLEKEQGISDLREMAPEVEEATKEWLAVLARCVQLQDAVAVLELDRVLEDSPEDLEQHRIGLKTTRRNRLEQITRDTGRLLDRIDAAATAGRSTWNVLQHPKDSGFVVTASNRIADNILSFCHPLGIEQDRSSMDSKGWMQAVAEVKDKAVETGANGVDQAKSVGRRLSSGVRAFREAVKDESD
ncbi:hypothetical protein [Acidipropionibacterium virtanenii]|uniref:Uncharacterized protein n=1 Tax=Acidipropionibacterium virtanenii TaxID=2057246 RepID=A0A344UV22_9ACTN|nr:hypothetical protein [Acidipropionibacterium virtanenii]AXE39120.1 hypothetical protein JS278_01964 [Acidipropionibacterium virtanenii]